MTGKISVVIEQDEHGCYAWCPELKGCQSQGDTVEEALANIREAIELYLETLTDEERSAAPRWWRSARSARIATSARSGCPGRPHCRSSGSGPARRPRWPPPRRRRPTPIPTGSGNSPRTVSPARRSAPRKQSAGRSEEHTS